MKNILFILLFFSLSIIYTCKEENESEPQKVELDKKITLILLEESMGTGLGQNVRTFNTTQTYFQKSDFPGIDSISFVINGVYVNMGSISVELVDLSNNYAVIENSKITTGPIEDTVFLASKNLINSIPSKPVNIGVRIWINNYETGKYCYVNHACLVLIRK